MLSGAAYIYAPGPHGANICAVSEPRATTHVAYSELQVGSKDFHEACANADLIIQAVNNFDPLKRALRALLEMLDREDDGATWRLSDVEREAHAVLAAAEAKE